MNTSVRDFLPLSTTILFGAVAVYFLSAIGGGNPAMAATYQLYNCKQSSCTHNWTLGKLATKEIRGVCDSGNGRLPLIDFPKKGKNTTCTIWYTGQGKYGTYKTRSCTNWSVAKKDTITIKLTC